jgi:hypothetical protein
LVAASRSASPSTTNPRSWAVAAGIPITTVKLPAACVPTSAAAMAGLAAPGLAAGVNAGTALETVTGLMSDVLTAGATGMGASVGGETSADGVTEKTCADGVLTTGVLATGVLDGALLGDGDGDGEAAMTGTVPAAAGIVGMAGLEAAPAVAVRVTEVAPEATGSCACIWNDDGVTALPIGPIVHVAAPFPLGQRLVNAGCSPWGAAVSVTDTPDAGPFWVETCTVKDAARPGLTLDADVWTLTHNCACGDDVEAAGSGSHWELVTASAGGLPCAMPSSPRTPEIRQAATTRRRGSRRRPEATMTSAISSSPLGFRFVRSIPGRIRRPGQAPR